MRLVLISDTHTHEAGLKMPAGDGLIVAGDITNLFKNGWDEQVRRFADWLKMQPYEFKAVIGGNHDRVLQMQEEWARGLLGEESYLCDSEMRMGGLRVWGAPWTPAHDPIAFNLPHEVIGAKWKLIPDGIDVLVTHGPPYGILDRTFEGPGGDLELLAAVERVRPLLHVFGHLHEGHGTRRVGKTSFVNASVAGGGDMGYRPVWEPVVVDVERGRQAVVVSD
jgi:Icc-related predicted phosphoesterase